MGNTPTLQQPLLEVILKAPCHYITAFLQQEQSGEHPRFVLGYTLTGGQKGLEQRFRCIGFRAYSLGCFFSELGVDVECFGISGEGSVRKEITLPSNFALEGSLTPSPVHAAKPKIVSIDSMAASSRPQNEVQQSSLRGGALMMRWRPMTDRIIEIQASEESSTARPPHKE